jgi:hypothetical protein
MAYYGNDSMSDFFSNMRDPDKFRKEYRRNMDKIRYDDRYKKVIIFHPDRKVSLWFIDMMNKLDIKNPIDFRTISDANDFNGLDRNVPIWIYDPSSWYMFRDSEYIINLIKSRFLNVREIPRLKEPWRDEFKDMFKQNVNIDHSSEECEAYKEFIRVTKEEGIDEAKAIKAICALYEIKPHQLFKHSECGKKKEKLDFDWSELIINVNSQEYNFNFDSLKDLDI